MKKSINLQEPAQAANEENRTVFQESVRNIVREGLLKLMEDEVLV